MEPLRAEVHNQVMTKADGLRLQASLQNNISALRTELRPSMRDQLKWTVGLLFTFSGVIIAAIKLL